MDTISRENNSILPIAGVLVGVLALLLSGVALVKLSSANKTIEGLKESMTKIDSVEAEARAATSSAEQAKSAADNANRGISSLQNSTQSGFNSVATELTNLHGEIEKLHAPKPVAGAAGPGGAAKGEKAEKAAPVAGEGEYLVKAGDSGVKIAKAHGVSLDDLKAVNPGVNWSGLKVAQKIKIPKK